MFQLTTTIMFQLTNNQNASTAASKAWARTRQGTLIQWSDGFNTFHHTPTLRCLIHGSSQDKSQPIALSHHPSGTIYLEAIPIGAEQELR